LVEQWSEESREPLFAQLPGNSRLIPKFRVEEQWSQRSIVLWCGGQAALFEGNALADQVAAFDWTNCLAHSAMKSRRTLFVRQTQQARCAIRS